LKKGKETVRKRGRKSNSNIESEYKEKKLSGNVTKIIPGPDIRLDKVGHFPAVGESRYTCKLPGCSGKVVIYCVKCNVNLCCDKKRNCFYKFHNE